MPQSDFNFTTSLQTEIQSLRVENQELRIENQRLHEENQALRAENQLLKAAYQSLHEKFDILMNEFAALKEENQRLKDEIAVLKGQKPRPKIPPSRLEGPKSKDKDPQSPRVSRSKHPRKKTPLEFHHHITLIPEEIPEDAVFKGYRRYAVQDVILESNNTRYLVGRWQLPDGRYLEGKLPHGIQGHYGPVLCAHIIHQYYVCRVTEPLLLKQLHAIGVKISAGQLSNILIKHKEAFHEEVKELLPAGIKAHNQIQTDDTGARHKGKNYYTNVVGNEWFSVFTTSDSKSRVNFFIILQSGKHEYLINEDAIAYLEAMKALPHLSGIISLYKESKFLTKSAWEEFLRGINITSEQEIRVVTEAALCASVIENGVPRDLGVHADDAKQFDLFIRSLCWIHEERHYRKIIPIDEQGRIDLERVRDQIWKIYRRLIEYKKAPDEATKQEIDKEFDLIFLEQETTSTSLNKRLRMTHAKKKELLRVLERPDTPLHNNSSETDARAVVTKRKVSGGTRSEEGKKARDTFLSLMQTCRKLRINSIEFLSDRLRRLYKIPRLAEVIRERAAPLVHLPP